MAIFNYASDEVILKVVYYGPARGGKTTNLEYIYNHSDQAVRGKLISLMTESDRTLFFDLLPLELGKIKGLNIKMQLYTTPGQVHLNSTRKLVLKGVDAVVFVADSQVNQVEANLASLETLKTNMADIGLQYDSIPIVFQFNKRDLNDISSVEEMNAILNPMNLQSIPASAINGEGVFETLKTISKDVINKIQTAKPTVTQENSQVSSKLQPKQDVKAFPGLQQQSSGLREIRDDIIDLEEKIHQARRTLNILVKTLLDLEGKIFNYKRED